MLVALAPDTSHALMSSLKDAAAELHLLSQSHAENKYDMSVTSDVSHVEMWPYIASAAARSSIQARTAVRMLSSPNAPSKNVGASVTHMPPSERPRTIPHDVDSHGVLGECARRGPRRCPRTSRGPGSKAD